MVAAVVFYSPDFHDCESSTFGAILWSIPIEGEDAMCYTLHLEVGCIGSAVIQHNDRTFPIRKKLLEREHLPPVAK